METLLNQAYISGCLSLISSIGFLLFSVVTFFSIHYTVITWGKLKRKKETLLLIINFCLIVIALSWGIYVIFEAIPNMATALGNPEFWVIDKM